jgi:hypothetical protein
MLQKNYKMIKKACTSVKGIKQVVPDDLTEQKLQSKATEGRERSLPGNSAATGGVLTPTQKPENYSQRNSEVYQRGLKYRHVCLEEKQAGEQGEEKSNQCLRTE